MIYMYCQDQNQTFYKHLLAIRCTCTGTTQRIVASWIERAQDELRIHRDHRLSRDAECHYAQDSTIDDGRVLKTAVCPGAIFTILTFVAEYHRWRGTPALEFSWCTHEEEGHAWPCDT
jgi:hypothetical protein